jgi:hypothetical protein
MTEASATADGELARTPLAHLLVYALDRRLTGALYLASPPSPESVGNETVVRLCRGVPVKVKPGDGFSPLGEMLVAAGAIDEATLRAALATPGLLGDILLLAGRVERDTLERIAREQFIRRMVRLFALPPASTYRYHDGDPALAEYGGDEAQVDPLELLWAGLREHAEVSTLMEATLARLGDSPLRLHAAATASRFAFDGSEAPFLEVLATGAATLADLAASGPPSIGRRLAYALTISRQLDVGAGPSMLPLGADVPISSSTRSVPAGASLGRMALKSTVHRLGAAAPDAPGAGERASVGSRRVRERTSTSSGDEPSSSSRPIGVSASLEDSAIHPPSSSRSPESGVIPIETVRASVAEPASMEDAVPATARTGNTAPPTALPEAESAESLLDELSPSELLCLALDCLEQGDHAGALEACDVGCTHAPGDADLVALRAWARSQGADPDLKVLVVALDELLLANDAHADARYYRAMLRLRLGDEAGWAADLRRVIELEPEHARALAEAAKLPPKSERPVSGPPPSLFGRLFRR